MLLRKSLHEAKAGASWASGWTRASLLDSVCHKYSTAQGDQLDSREKKSRSPDVTKQARWIDSWKTPEFGRGARKNKPASTKAGKRSSPTCTDVKYGTAVYLKSSQRNEKTWTALIWQQIKCGQAAQALTMYEEMQKAGVTPSTYSFVAALKACSRLNDLESVKRIHAEVVANGLESHSYVGNMLVDVYAKCRSLVDGRQVFERMTCRDVVSWTAMITGYAQLNKGEEALQLYNRMQQEGVVPNDQTYISALKACTAIAESGEETGRCLATVRSIHADVIKVQLESHLFVSNMLVDAYAKCGSLEESRQVFEKMPQRDVISWTSMILGCAQMDNGKEGLRLYMRMQEEGMAPNDRTYVAALKACSKIAESGEGNKGHDLAVKERCLVTVRGIHTDIVNRKLEVDVFIGTMLVEVYAKCESLEDARRVFEIMPCRDTGSWNAMMFGFAQMKKGKEALQLYARMQTEGVAPDARTFVSALKACSSLAETRDRNPGVDLPVDERWLNAVRTIHANAVTAKCESNAYVETMLVDVYAKFGSLVDARHVFERIPRRDVVSWTSLILGYAQMDMGEEALQLFTRMKMEGVVPDAQTYVGALNACGSVAGLEKGKEIHAQFLKAGLDASDIFVAHSLIDMYGKCGSMEDAQQVFDAVPRREIVAWNALIAGYAHQGESELVFDLFHRMRQEGMQPDAITFLGVLTVCSHVGLVDLGQEYFEVMVRDFGITPTIKHFTCIVDLLGRAGHLGKAMEIVKAMPYRPHSVVLWRCILGACRKWGDVELGRKAFDCAVRLKKDDAAAYVLISNIYAAAHMREEAKQMQAVRVKLRAWKQPGRSLWTEMSGYVHVFLAGDRSHPENRKIREKLRGLLKKEGYESHLDSVLQDIPVDQKEDALCGHSEKLAIVYAPVKTPEGTTIRVVCGEKSAGCEHCHIWTALISRTELRTKICRDAYRFHIFKDGRCSCRDYW